MNFTAESQMTQAVRVKLEPPAFQRRGRRPPGVASTSDFMSSEFLQCRALSSFQFVTVSIHACEKIGRTGLALPGTLHHAFGRYSIDVRLHKLYLALWFTACCNKKQQQPRFRFLLKLMFSWTVHIFRKGQKQGGVRGRSQCLAEGHH